MSSILYIEVTAAEGDRLTCLLAAIQAYEDFAPSPTLAAQLILESWAGMRRGRLADATRARGSGGLYCPFSEEEAAASPIRELMPEEDDDILVVDEEFIRRAAERIVRSTRVAERRHCLKQFRHRFAPRPEGVFEVEVAGPAWIGHLAPGVCWDSTAFPYETGW